MVDCLSLLCLTKGETVCVSMFLQTACHALEFSSPGWFANSVMTLLHFKLGVTFSCGILSVFLAEFSLYLKSLNGNNDYLWKWKFRLGIENRWLSLLTSSSGSFSLLGPWTGSYLLFHIAEWRYIFKLTQNDSDESLGSSWKFFIQFQNFRFW